MESMDELFKLEHDLLMQIVEIRRRQRAVLDQHRHLATAAELTPTETTVLFLVRERLQNKEIAAKLGTSPRTIKFHVANLLRKFGVTERAML